MSWGDDVRCLYCDGRLPLYRKLTDGQFCSASHRKAYWLEQQRLGVERLQSTQTFRVAAYASELLQAEDGADRGHASSPEPGSLVTVREPVATLAISNPAPKGRSVAIEPALLVNPPASDNGMPQPGLVPFVLRAVSGSRAMLAADPMEYEISPIPLNPHLARHGQPENAGDLQAASLMALAQWVALDPPLHRAQLDGAADSPWIPLVAYPSTGQGMLNLAGPEPLLAGRTRIRIEGAKYRIHSPARTAPASFPAAWAVIPTSNAHPAGEMEDAIAELIPPIFIPLRYALGEPRSYGAQAAAPEPPTAFERAPSLPVPVHECQEAVLSNASTGLLTLRFDAVSMPIAPKEAAGAVFTESSELSFATPRLTPGRSRFSMGWAQVVGLPWTAAFEHAMNWQPAVLDAAAPVAFPSSMHHPVLDITREAASIKGSSRQRKLAYKLTRDHAPSRQAQIPRVYFAPQPALASPLLPTVHLEPVDAAPSQVSAREFVFAPQRPSEEAVETARVRSARRQAAEEEKNPGIGQLALHRIRLAPVAAFWKNAPRDLKLLAMTLPLLIGLAIQPSLPKVRVTASVPNPEISRVVETQWNGLRQNILERAGIELSDDFRAGLEAWQSKSDLTESWSYDAAGFVKPGPLAIFEPSMKLSDYQVQFLGQISKKALGFVYRASDLDNYYVARLVVLRPGPLPTVALQRYAVVNGKAGPKTEKILPITTRADMLYRVRLDVQGEYFALRVQGHLVDFWSDSRWKTGGVGFFNAPGEESRVRWVQISHQYDALGRLCAYLAPYSAQGSAGGLKE
ncbi:MAG: hypothetical protein ABI823_03965 [Bryobacteraceae bacterium]